MKSLRNKIILSGLVLLFALVATIGSTFAWFTVSNTVSVPALQLNVQSSESLLIRVYNGEAGTESSLLNASTYKANLSSSDIAAATTAGYQNLGTYHLSPVTMTASQTGTTLTPKTPNLMDVDSKIYSVLSGGINSSTGYVIDVKFWVLSQGATGDIVLQDLVITANNTLTAQDAIVNAVRLAIWNSLNYDASSPTDPSETAKVYGLDKDYAFAFGAGTRGYDTTGLYYYDAGGQYLDDILNSDGTVAYTFTDASPDTWSDGVSTFKLDGSYNLVDNATGLVVELAADKIYADASAYTTANAAFRSIAGGTQTTLSGLHSMYYESGATLLANVVTPTIADAAVITSLTPNIPSLINVRIYIEGWDAQTTNAVLAAVFSISFKFTLQDA